MIYACSDTVMIRYYVLNIKGYRKRWQVGELDAFVVVSLEISLWYIRGRRS